MKRMNILKGIAVSAMALLALASCSNEDAGSLLPSAQDRVPLQVSVEDAATRGIITGTTLPDDCSYRIYAYSRNSETNYEALNNQSGSTVQYQKGVSRIDDNPIYLPEDGSDVQVVALYGGITGSYDNLWVNKIKLSEKAQEDYLVGVNTNKVNKANPKANLTFIHVMSRVTLNIKRAKDNTNSYKIPEVTINNLAFDAYMDVREGKPVINGVNNSQDFNLPIKIDDYVLDDSSKVITADFLVLPAAQENITVKLDGFSQEIKLPISNFEMGQQYSFNVVIGKNKPEITESKHEYVDLGLPSGTKWATHNLDMSRPNKETASVENYGSYCNWADPTGENVYKDENTLPSANPPVSICNSDYDIAHVQWGKEWSLPTSAMVRELNANCTWEYVEINGVKCGKAIGPNGNYIILPLGGCWLGNNSTATDEGTLGYYWTGECHKSSVSDKYYADCLQVNGQYDFIGCTRTFRCLIRPVTN